MRRPCNYFKTTSTFRTNRAKNRQHSKAHRRNSDALEEKQNKNKQKRNSGDGLSNPTKINWTSILTVWFPGLRAIRCSTPTRIICSVGSFRAPYLSAIILRHIAQALVSFMTDSIAPCIAPPSPYSVCASKLQKLGQGPWSHLTKRKPCRP